MLAENYLFVARFTRFTVLAARDLVTRLARAVVFLTARLVFLAGDVVSIDGNVTFGSDFGMLFCTSVTAVSAACLTVDCTVVRACFQTALARVIERANLRKAG